VSTCLTGKSGDDCVRAGISPSDDSPQMMGVVGCDGLQVFHVFAFSAFHHSSVPLPFSPFFFFLPILGQSCSSHHRNLSSVLGPAHPHHSSLSGHLSSFILHRSRSLLLVILSPAPPHSAAESFLFLSALFSSVPLSLTVEIRG
jgi:hypothetical protein